MVLFRCDVISEIILGKFTRVGPIVRLNVNNFMQYKDTEYKDADLIKVGEWAATVEVVVPQSEEQNVVICRHGTKQARATGLPVVRSLGYER